VFTHGGDKANIVPDRAAMQWYVRSGTSASLARLEPRVVAALEAGALATGASVDIEWKHPPYADLVDNAALLAAYGANLARRGRTVSPKADRPDFIGSTDMGDVSHVVPSIHPMISVAPRGVAIHTAEFATHARSARGDTAVVDGAVALADTIVDLWTDPALLSGAQEEFHHAERSPSAG
jgi:metal-dependent amidase/aminoacylase/carboxypeptidase family protein